MVRVFVLLLAAILVCVHCNYECLCNYDVECAVRDQPNANATVQGYLYEFDCKPTIGNKASVNGWVPIAMQHQVGYVNIGNYAQIQTCQGSPSALDVVKSTTRSSTTSTRKLTTTVTKSTTRQATTTTTHAPTTTLKPTTTSLPTTQTIQPTRIITQAPTTRVGSLTNMTTKPRTTTQQTLVVGNVNLCPAKLHQYTREDKGALTQYGDRCLEIVPIRAIWARAENDCRAKGGHLVHIENKAQQDFIYKWIKSYNFDHAVWTGLNDLLNEEYFQWISGDHLLYTNWYPDRYGNLASHHLENCVLLVPYAPYYGQWDDVNCGIKTMFGDSGQQNPFICEYLITPHHNSPLVVVG